MLALRKTIRSINQIIIERIIDLPARRMTALKPNFRPVERRRLFFRGENHRKTFKIYANKQKLVCSSKGSGPMSFATLKSQQLQITTLDLHKKEIISSQAKMKEEFREPCISLLNYFP